MKLVLLCNYRPDEQQSMLRFGALIERLGRERGWNVSVIEPRPGPWRALGRGRRGRWIGYADKYVRFPAQLGRARRRWRESPPDIVHVVDHSNAVYVPRRPGEPWVVTCHDLLAVRGARGEATDCPATWLGKRLQAAIVRGLGRAAAVACDSTSTRDDLERLVRATRPQVRRVIRLGLHHPYRALAPDDARSRLASRPGVPWTEPFLVHVGSNLARKNKAGVLRVFARWREHTPGNLVFCGAPLPEELHQLAIATGVRERVFAVAAPDNHELEAIYSLAHALIYPSTCEGFGWPVIEAQACGCPVVCSDRTSLPEVGGAAALVHALEDEAGMVESLRRLGDGAQRARIIALGHENRRRFGAGEMIDAYAALYEEVRAGNPRR